MFNRIKLFKDLKTLYQADDKILDLYNFLKCVTRYGEGDTLIITPTQEASKRVFKDMLSDFNNYIAARYVRDGKGYEFVFKDNERIIIQDIGYLLNCRHHDGLRFKEVRFME